MNTTYQIFEIFGHELKRTQIVETSMLYFQFASDYKTREDALAAINKYYNFCKKNDLTWLLHNKFVVIEVSSHNAEPLA